MQDREERARRLLVAGRDCTPLFEPVPHPLDPLPVHIDPVWAVDGSLIAPGGDGRSGAQLPDGRAQRVRRGAAIYHNPAGDGGQKVEEIEALWRLAGLPGGESKPRAQPRASASAWALVPKPPWLRGQAPRRCSPFSRPGCLLVRPDDGAIHEDQAQLGPACRLGTLRSGGDLRRGRYHRIERPALARPVARAASLRAQPVSEPRCMELASTTRVS